MALFADLLPDARADLARCPTPLVIQQLRLSAIELCRQSSVWRELCEPLALAEGKADYELVPPVGGARVIKPWGSRAWIDSVPRPIRPYQEIFHKPAATTGQPIVIGVRPSSNVVTVWPTPGAAEAAAGTTIQINGVLVPTKNSLALPSRILDDWRDAIAAGARWRLMIMQDKPWTDPAGARIYRDIFYRGINRAQREANSSGGAILRVEPHPFV